MEKLAEDRCVVTVNRRLNADARLFVLPHAGGASNYYRAWDVEFGDAIELNIIEYPGHGIRSAETPVTGHKPLVAEIAEAIAHDGTRTAVFGHSMGALLAYEATRALLSMGRPPAHLFVSAAKAPSTHVRPISRTWTDEDLAAELARYGATPEELLEDDYLRNMLFTALRGDYRLLDQYVFEAGDPLPIGVTAFYGTQDPIVSREDMTEWARHTSAGFNVHPVPGGHFYNATSIPRLCAIVAKVTNDCADSAT